MLAREASEPRCPIEVRKKKRVREGDESVSGRGDEVMGSDARRHLAVLRVAHVEREARVRGAHRALGRGRRGGYVSLALAEDLGRAWCAHRGE